MKNCKSKKIRLGFYTISLKSKIIFCWVVFLVVLFIVLFVVFLVVFLVVLRYDDYRVFIYSTHIYSPFVSFLANKKRTVGAVLWNLIGVMCLVFAWCLPSFFYDLMMIDIEWLVFISVDVIDKANNRQRKHKCLKKCHGITSLVPYQSERRFSSYPHYITHIYIFNMLWQKSYLLSLYTKSGNCTIYEL